MVSPTYRPPSWPTSSDAFLPWPRALNVCESGRQLRARLHERRPVTRRGRLGQGGLAACARSVRFGRSMGEYLRRARVVGRGVRVTSAQVLS